MALSDAERKRRSRERKKQELEAAPEITHSILKMPFNEYVTGDLDPNDGWNDVTTYLEWAGIEERAIPSFDEDTDPEYREEYDNGPNRGSIGRAERMVGCLLDAAVALANMINHYKMREIDRAIAEIEGSDLSDADIRKKALNQIVKLNQIRDRLGKQVRWTIPQWKVKGE